MTHHPASPPRPHCRAGAVATQRPGDLPRLAHLGPNWFAAVMGTGIVANATITLPRQVVGLHTFALVVWAVALLLLLTLLAATAAHWVRHPVQARGHLAHPTMAHSYGAPPMAMLTVGAGTLLVGKDLLGLHVAVEVDWVLWIAGTVTGLLCAVIVPYTAFTQHSCTPDSASGGWLMSVVPPMVSASTGALLLPHIAAGQPRETLLLGCYAMFGLSVVASLVIVTMIWSRLVQHGTGAAAAVPTLWIVLGPLGQSITAAGLLGTAADKILPHPYGAGATALALLYGVITWGFAALWFTLAAAVTVRTARDGLPFSLTWWSFTFPVGTLVTGTSNLATRTGLDVVAWSAVGLYAFLLLAWVTVASRTAHGARTGSLLGQAAAATPVEGSPVSAALRGGSRSA